MDLTIAKKTSKSFKFDPFLIHFDPICSDQIQEKNVKTMFILMVNLTNFGFDYRKERLFKTKKRRKKFSLFLTRKNLQDAQNTTLFYYVVIYRLDDPKFNTNLTIQAVSIPPSPPP